MGRPKKIPGFFNAPGSPYRGHRRYCRPTLHQEKSPGAPPHHPNARKRGARWGPGLLRRAPAVGYKA